jgi:NADPH2:quinone reductase
MTANAEMRAIQVFRPGGPEVLQCVRLPVPVPAPEEIRVRAQAIGVGRPDILMRRGTYKWMPPLPAIPGTEMAGVIDAVGTEVDPSLLGRKILVSARELASRSGCYAEWICAPKDAGFLLPEAISPVDAVSLPNFQLANALLASAGLATPSSVLVMGVAGAVGSALADWARSKGIVVIGSVSSPEKNAFARTHGVTQLVDSEPSSLADQVRSLTQGRGVDIAFDHVGGASIMACLETLAPMGTLVSYNAVQGPPTGDLFMAMRGLLSRSLGLRTFSMHTLDDRPDDRRALMHQAIDAMAEARIRAPAAIRLPLDHAAEAHRLLESRSSFGKIVLEP